MKIKKMSFADENDQDRLSLDLRDLSDSDLPSNGSAGMKFNNYGTPSSLKYISRRDSFGGKS